MSDSGYIRLVKSQIADKKAESEGLEELLDDENISDSDKYFEIRSLHE
ncbi:MAG: hypothetical protein Q8N78_01450 [Sulfurimonas sp.]|nr:hypothetical protein [Sulfurimonas sp.]